MSFEHAAAEGAWNGGSGGDESNSFNVDAHHENGNGNFADSGDGGFACRNCGQEGHMARECPEPKKLTQACYSCGEVGHNRAECPNSEPEVCKNCGETGHKQAACQAPRKLNRDAVADLPPEEAWALIRDASLDKDLDKFKDGLASYCKAQPDLTYADIEKRLREEKLNFYIIALEREMPQSLTNVNLQGKSDCKFQASFSFSAKPKRVKFAQGWPSSAEENLTRLGDTGEAMEILQMICRRCNQIGHGSKTCTEERIEPVDRPEIKCDNCGEAGHRLRDCDKPRVDPFACKNCGEAGHRAAECEKPRDESTMECRRCGQMGHSGKNCPDAPSRACRNCGEEGHMAKECEKPRSMANVQCRNCDAYGHLSKDCDKPRDYSRVQCQNCGKMGHTKVKCKEPPKEEGEGGGMSGGGEFSDDGGASFGNNQPANGGSDEAQNWEAGAGAGGGSSGW